MVTPAARREAVAYLCESFEVSHRHAHRLGPVHGHRPGAVDDPRDGGDGHAGHTGDIADGRRLAHGIIRSPVNDRNTMTAPYDAAITRV